MLSFAVRLITAMFICSVIVAAAVSAGFAVEAIVHEARKQHTARREWRRCLENADTVYYR